MLRLMIRKAVASPASSASSASLVTPERCCWQLQQSTSRRQPPQNRAYHVAASSALRHSEPEPTESTESSHSNGNYGQHNEGDNNNSNPQHQHQHQQHQQQQQHQQHQPPRTGMVSDADFELRTGRAVYVLQQTLPGFFASGLVTCVDRATGTPRPDYGLGFGVAGRRPLAGRKGVVGGIGSGIGMGIGINIGTAIGTATGVNGMVDGMPRVRRQNGGSSSSGGGGGGGGGGEEQGDAIESIYSPNVRLSYTPPTVLPAPFPRTLNLEGLPLYLASSVFVRHTMNALYSDLHVVLRRCIINPPSGTGFGNGNGNGGGGSGSSLSSSSSSSPSSPLSSPSSHLSEGEEDEEGRTPWPKTTTTTNGAETDSGLGLGAYRKPRISRDKSVLITLAVAGTMRLGASKGEWEVNSTYTFSPNTGLIYRHVINSIHPAPHQAVYDALRSSLGSVFGYGPAGAGAAVSCGTTTVPARSPVIGRNVF